MIFFIKMLGFFSNHRSSLTNTYLSSNLVISIDLFLIQCKQSSLLQKVTHFVYKEALEVSMCCLKWISLVLWGSSKYSIVPLCISSHQPQQCSISRYKWQYLVHTIFWEVGSRCGDLRWAALFSWERRLFFFCSGVGKHHYRNTRGSNLKRCRGTRLEPVNMTSCLSQRKKILYYSGVALSELRRDSHLFQISAEMFFLKVFNKKLIGEFDILDLITV